MNLGRYCHALLISGSQVRVLQGAPFKIKYLAVLLETLDFKIGVFGRFSAKNFSLKIISGSFLYFSIALQRQKLCGLVAFINELDSVG